MDILCHRPRQASQTFRKELLYAGCPGVPQVSLLRPGLCACPGSRLRDLGYAARFRVSRKYTTGVTIRLRTIEIVTPPITAIASGCSICDPAPKANASG